MTKNEAVKEFRVKWCDIVAAGKYQWRDRPAHNLAWGLYTDDLCRTGKITPRQYANWEEPKMLKRVPKAYQDKI